MLRPTPLYRSLQHIQLPHRTMSTLPSPLPVVLCGRKTEIGKPVSGSLAPEFEGVFRLPSSGSPHAIYGRIPTNPSNSPVIHFIQTNEAALTELPRLLAGQDPQSSHDNGVGTHNYSRPARGVIFGRGYSLEEVEEFRKASAGCNMEPVVWVTGDPAKKPDSNAPPPGPGYAQAAADGVKAVLAKWRDEGGVRDGIVFW